MNAKRKALTRRAFVRNTVLAGMAAALAPSFAGERKARVVLVRDKGALSPDGKPVPEVLEKMLDSAMASLFQAPDAETAWKGLFSPEDAAGVKTNAWRRLPTPPEMENIIEKKLASCGLRKENVSIDDQGVRDNPVFQKAQKLINVRPLRTHHWSGVGGCLKNPIMFADSPSSYHDDFCADLGKMWKDTGIVGKVKLNILVLLTPLFYGIGPHHYDTKYVWRYHGLLLGTDPVAVDRVGLEILVRKRKSFFGKETPFKPTAHHIELAGTRHGLGVSDLKKIDLVRLGLEEGAFLD